MGAPVKIPAAPVSPLLIEFVGLPGSGKTTISHLLVQKLNEAGESAELARETRIRFLKTTSRPRKIVIAMRNGLVWRLPLIVASFLLFLHIRPFNRDSFMRCLFLYQHDIFMAPEGRHLVLDQGKIQEVWSAIYLNRLTSDWFMPLFWRSFSKGRTHLLVHVDVPIEETLNRMARRNDHLSRFERMPLEDAGAALRGIKDRLLKLAHQCADEQGSTWLTLDGMKPSGESADTVAAHVLATGELSQS